MAAEVSSLACRAEIVFLGQVVAIRPSANLQRAALTALVLGPQRSGSPTAVALPPAGVVEVEFRIDAVLKGTANASYTLREWSGLWAGGTPRYWVGERAVMFISAASAAGFAGPVDGMEGVVPVAGFSEAQPLLDLTRLRSSLQRAVGAPMADPGASLSLGGLQALITPASTAAPPVPVAQPHPAAPPPPMEWQPYPGRLPVVKQPVPKHLLRSLPMRSLPHPEVQ